MLPISLLPTRRPVLALMAMPEAEFLNLYIGDGDGMEFEEPDLLIIDAFNDLVTERAHHLMSDWQHREAVIDIVECFAPLPSCVESLDEAILEVSRWLGGHGPRAALRAKGLAYETAEIIADRCQDMVDEQDHSEGDPEVNHQRAIADVARLAETSTFHLVFGDVWIGLALLSDRVRVMIDLASEGEVDMGGHHWDGDEDRDVDPTTPPLMMV